MVHCTFNRKLDPLGNLVKRLKFLSPNKDAIIMQESLYEYFWWNHSCDDRFWKHDNLIDHGEDRKAFLIKIDNIACSCAMMTKESSKKCAAHSVFVLLVKPVALLFLYFPLCCHGWSSLLVVAMQNNSWYVTILLKNWRFDGNTSKTSSPGTHGVKAHVLTITELNK